MRTVALQQKSWPEGLRRELKDWETYRTILATELPAEEWVALVRSIVTANAESSTDNRLAARRDIIRNHIGRHFEARS